MSRGESEAPAGGSGIPDSWCAAPGRHERSKPRQTLFQIAGPPPRPRNSHEQTSGSWGTQDCEGQRARFVTGKGQKHCV